MDTRLLQELKERMRSYENEDLARMVSVQRDEYTPEAIQLAEEELRSRGFEGAAVTELLVRQEQVAESRSSNGPPVTRSLLSPKWRRQLRYAVMALLLLVGIQRVAQALFGFGAASSLLAAVVLFFFIVWILDLLGVWKRLERKTGEHRTPSEETAPPASLNPLSIASFLLVEFANLRDLEKLFAHFGASSFVDVTPEATAAGEWNKLDLTPREVPHLLAFVANGCNGEVEFIFSAGRLVQGGILLVGELDDAPFMRRVFEGLVTILDSRFVVTNVSQAHMMFSDNVLNGYLRQPDSTRLAFRVAELKWCEEMYGPSVKTPL
jgi:hypothetical protein